MRNHQIFNLQPANPKAVSNLQNWTEGTGCIARKETAYLNHKYDLLSAAAQDDTIIPWIETLFEKCTVQMRSWFKMVFIVISKWETSSLMFPLVNPIYIL